MNDSAQRPAPQVHCPICRRLTEFSPANRWRPFCSERCKTVDLGAWASNGYAIPGATDESADDPDGPAAPGSPRH